LVVGVTSEGFVERFKIQNLKLKIKYQNLKFENYQIRKRSVEDFLEKKAKGRYEILEIEDIFGPTLDEDFNAQAIVVSKNTKKGASEINKKRKEKGLIPFEVIESPDVLAEDGSLVTSHNIRSGKIDRVGKLYIKKQWLYDNLLLPESLRKEFQKPWGHFVKDLRKETEGEGLKIVVGDETSKVFNEKKLKAVVYVIDFKVAREKKFRNLKELGFDKGIKTRTVKNDAGTLTAELFQSSLDSTSAKEPTVIIVDGEEDLAVSPLILASPLGSKIFYGQPARHASISVAGGPGEGLIKVRVDEEIKAKVHDLVGKFKTLGH
jgi:uncharacterized protein (UPF0218 family)/phosphopantetheine adenylyltransferase